MATATVKSSNKGWAYASKALESELNFNYEEFDEYDRAYLTPKFPPAIQCEVDYNGLAEHDHIDTDLHALWCVFDDSASGEYLII